jgi:hypothetical protein
MPGVSISRHAVSLSDAQLDVLADRVAERLQGAQDASCPSEAPRLVDARAVAQALQISRDTVYAHAEQLGGRRVGAGPKGRLRFDLGVALAAWRAQPAAQDPRGAPPAGRAPVARRRRRGRTEGLLPIRGRGV